MAKTYKCPYCEKRLIRKDLISHIEKKHEELIPQDFSAARLVYNQINKTTCGRCRVCGTETTWNEKAGRYNVLCNNPKCKEHMREEYKKNMLRVKGTYNILNDPEQQKKMLANRSISGKYKFITDSGELTYTGSYERKCLEFMDVVMQIPSKDILSPGPTLEYEYEGKKHFYITDFYYIPYNLIIEVKDGGDNPNNKKSVGMNSSREKTIEKEHLITDKGEYNYIRLTNNNFAQLIEIFMVIKEKLLEGDVSKTYKINESVIFESNNEFKNETELLNWMKNNIKYEHNDSSWKLKSYEEILQTKSGDCHDQSLFEYTVFNQQNIKCGRLFIIEYYGDKIHNAGSTHTICYFIKNNKYYWFENAWDNKRGIHGPYSNLNELKEDIYVNWEFSGKNDRLYICNLSGVKPGMDLEEYVTTALDTLIPKKYYNKNIQESSINEANIFINQDNFEYNTDTLKPNSDNNILFITGYSGSGKSTTMARLYEKYGDNIYAVAGDDFFMTCRYKYRIDNGDKKAMEHPKFGFMNKESRNYLDPILCRYFDIYYNNINISIDEFNNPELFEYWEHFIRWLIKDTKENKAFYRNKVVIVEGIQISNTDPELYKNHALIITGTSAFTSWARKANRDIFEPKKYDWKHLKMLFTMIPVYANDYKKLNNLSKSMQESSINETYINTHNTGNISFMTEAYIDYISRKYKSNVTTINLRFVHSTNAIQAIKSKCKYRIYDNDYIIIDVGYNVYVVDDVVYNRVPQDVTYNSFLKFHLTKVILSRYMKDENERLINAIATYESGVYAESYKVFKSSQIKDAEIYAKYLNKYGSDAVIDNLYRRGHTQYPIFEACKDVNEARKFLQDVDEISQKYNANFFIVTDGASMTRNGRGKSNPAVKNARDSQVDWENKNGEDPNEDWLKDKVKESTNIFNFIEE